MAEELPINFAIPGESAVPSYNYADIVDGTGLAEFYFAQSEDSTGTTNLLLNKVLRSSVIEMSGSDSSTATNTKCINQNFNLIPFNSPRDIKGNMIISCCFGVKCGTGTTGVSTDGYLVFTLNKIHAGASTTLGSIQTATIHTHGSTPQVFSWKRVLMSKVLTQTHLEIGDYLQVNVEGWIYNSNGVYAGTIIFGTEPTNKDGVEILAANNNFTNSQINISFKIDL